MPEFVWLSNGFRVSFQMIEGDLQMKKRLCILLSALLLIGMLPVSVFAGETSRTGLTDGSGARVATKATLMATTLYGTATTSVTTPGISANYYSLATTITLYYTNAYGHATATNGTGSGYAGASISSIQVTSASSSHSVISSTFGNWGTALNVAP